MSKSNSIALRLMAAVYIPIVCFSLAFVFMDDPFTSNVLIVMAVVSAISGMVLWGWMMRDLWSQSHLAPHQQWLWCFILFVTGYMGATLYYFMVKTKVSTNTQPHVSSRDASRKNQHKALRGSNPNG